ncbi:MAG: hypothetical protein HZB71_11330 [Betaproteobacteria bacterium]|nr:hypothetical protein [Betaproteobacteria bacterium]
MTTAPLHLVDIELKRVQTFIFDVPRLKAMLGGNALIGETLRDDLTQLAEEKGACGFSPEGEDAASIGADQADPLQDDDPLALYRRGILVRDGGRFKAVFDDMAKASRFESAAREQLRRSLPGVRFDIKVTALDGSAEKDAMRGGGRKPSPEQAQLLDLPVLQVCQETGHDVASIREDGPSKQTWISQSVAVRKEAGNRFRKGETHDIVTLMRNKLRLDEASGWHQPQDLEGLCQGKYLALIHADGNSVGARYKRWMETYPGNPQDVIAREVHGEKFYRSMRGAVRKSLVAALQATVEVEPNTVRPYEILMLGGDDLLMACRADLAMNFVRHYAQELAKYPLADQSPLSVGVGVAIAKPSYPLHRLHALAEALAASAKRLFRSLPEEGRCSVVDWQIVTQSWFDDIALARRKAELRQYMVEDEMETLVLSACPYRVLNQTGGDSLEALMSSVAALDRQFQEGEATDPREQIARSPLRSLRQAFEAGRLSAELAFAGLPEPAREVLLGDKHGSPWQNPAAGIYLTRVMDIVGLREIRRLGSASHE